MSPIDQWRYIEIQSNTIDLSTRLWGINSLNSVVIPWSLVLRSIVLNWILIYRNLSVLILVIKKNRTSASGQSDSVCYHSPDEYRPNWTPLSPITITYLFVLQVDGPLTGGSRRGGGLQVYGSFPKNRERSRKGNYHYIFSFCISLQVKRRISVILMHLTALSRKPPLASIETWRIFHFTYVSYLHKLPGFLSWRDSTDHTYCLL